MEERGRVREETGRYRRQTRCKNAEKYADKNENARIQEFKESSWPSDLNFINPADILDDNLWIQAPGKHIHRAEIGEKMSAIK